MSLKLWVIRHGFAEDREDFKKTGLPDSQRPLIARGRRDVKALAKAIASTTPTIDIMGVSPYLRATETAEILLPSFRAARIFEMNELKPHTTALKTLRSLQKIGRAKVVAIVGHEPHLSRFLSFVLTGSSRSIFDLKKGGAALIEFNGRIEKKQAKIKCLLQPRILKRIKKS